MNWFHLYLSFLESVICGAEPNEFPFQFPPVLGAGPAGG